MALVVRAPTRVMVKRGIGKVENEAMRRRKNMPWTNHHPGAEGRLRVEIDESVIVVIEAVERGHRTATQEGKAARPLVSLEVLSSGER